MKRIKHLVALLLALLLLGSSALAFDTARDSGLLLLVNKSHSVSEDYVPLLTEISGLPAQGNGYRIRREAAQALSDMMIAMQEAGIKPCNVISTYRSFAYQQKLVNDKVAKRVANGQDAETAYQQVTMSTAPASCSEHQLGLAIDFSVSTSSSVSFGNTAAGAWLREHAWEYGFILRYQEAKSSFTGIVSEPWHYRFVGIPHAQIMYANGWCLEEYIAYLREYGSYTLVSGDMTYEIYWTQDVEARFSRVLDISFDNDGGWIITTGTITEPLSLVAGHWSEPSFRGLEERGVVFNSRINPRSVITRGEFADLCGLAYPEDPSAPLVRQDAARLLEASLSDRTLTYLVYSDLDQISGSAFQSVQMCVSNGIFTHGEEIAFRPADQMTWGEAAATALRYLESLDEADAEETTDETTDETDNEPEQNGEEEQ